MRQLLIVFHSQSMHAQSLALASYAAVKSDASVKVILRRAMDCSFTDVKACDGILLVTPENCGSMSGGMKDFLDRIYYPLERAELYALPYALIVSAGNSGTGSVLQIEKIFKGMKASAVQEPLVIFGQPDEKSCDNARTLALTMAAGLELGLF